MIQEHTTPARSHAEPMHISKFHKPPSDDGGFFTCGNQTLVGKYVYNNATFGKPTMISKAYELILVNITSRRNAYKTTISKFDDED